jgi:ubiquinone/menaquinone biosynthesis C-methylase UbiE
MDHRDHVRLIRDGVAGDKLWADFGAGQGAFTLALADLLGDSGEIYAIDQSAGDLRVLADQMKHHFPKITLHTRPADLMSALELPPLDGIIMANVLHYFRDKPPVLARLYSYLKPGGRLIMIEYDTDRGNQWVPYPLTYGQWETLAGKHGFVDTRLLAAHPSRFLGSFFSAVSLRAVESH